MTIGQLLLGPLTMLDLYMVPSVQDDFLHC